MPTDAPEIRIVTATTDDELAEAMAIRFIVFVDEQKVPTDLEPDEFDAAAQHLLAIDPDGAAIATARIVDKGEGKGKIGRVAVLSAWRGHGIGSALMKHVLTEMKRRGFRLAFLDSQLYVIPFYERLGFIAEGPVFDDAGIDHRRMTLLLAAD